MRVVVDTQSFLWFIDGSPRLSAAARSAIEDAANDRFLSMASVWEMAIKISAGKLNLGQPIEVLIPYQLQYNGLWLMGITLDHLAVVARLPFHHRDPFDRLLVAQADVESLIVVSNDTALDAYGITRLW